MKEKRMLGVEKMTVGLINQLKSDDSTPHLVSVGRITRSPTRFR